MEYNSLSDMLLDSRRGLESEIRKSNTIEEALEKALKAYDWIATEYLRHERVSIIAMETWTKKYGQKALNSVELKSMERVYEVITAASEYLYDVEHGRKVGISAEEDDHDD